MTEKKLWRIALLFSTARESILNFTFKVRSNGLLVLRSLQLYEIQGRMLHTNIVITRAPCKVACLAIKRRNKIARQVLNAYLKPRAINQAICSEHLDISY